MFLWKKYLKNILMVSGVVLWVGALSPEIFIQTGPGCILDENGEELSAQDAKAFMESYFYRNSDKNVDEDSDENDNTQVEIQYKFALMELFQ